MVRRFSTMPRSGWLPGNGRGLSLATTYRRLSLATACRGLPLAITCRGRRPCRPAVGQTPRRIARSRHGPFKARPHRWHSVSRLRLRHIRRNAYRPGYIRLIHDGLLQQRLTARTRLRFRRASGFRGDVTQPSGSTRLIGSEKHFPCAPSPEKAAQRRTRIGSPLQGSGYRDPHFPGRRPWAILGRPFRPWRPLRFASGFGAPLLRAKPSGAVVLLSCIDCS